LENGGRGWETRAEGKVLNLFSLFYALLIFGKITDEIILHLSSHSHIWNGFIYGENYVPNAMRNKTKKKKKK
jgi:hypothetical protein